MGVGGGSGAGILYKHTLGTPTNTAHLRPASRMSAAFATLSPSEIRDPPASFRLANVYKSATAAGELAVKKVAV